MTSALQLTDALISKISNPNTDDSKFKSKHIPTFDTSTFKSLRIQNLIKSFGEKYNGASPDFIIQSPGRVNLIGEHIDYCGYDVLPMAVEKTILFAVKIINDSSNLIELANTEKSFKDEQINLLSKSDTTICLGHKARKWSIYFLAAYNGVIKNYASKINISKLKSLQILVSGNVPKGSGLSSSSAFVCGSAVTLLFSNLSCHDFEHFLTKSEVASFCIQCEREVGVMSGGMDQTICLLATRGFAKHIEFVPSLAANDVQLPSSKRVRWIITNCLLQHQLQDEEGTNNYNTRVVECRLATMLIGKLLKIANWKELKTLRQVQNECGLTLEKLINKVENLMNDSAYGIKYLEKEFGTRLEDLMNDLTRSESVLKNLRNLDYALPLKQRALHVYGEANRVLMFRDLCNCNDGKIEVKKLGNLMNLSHESCRDLYECSCKELDLLQSECIKAGSLGSRLTGAGWGGCVVSLVEVDKVESFKEQILNKYYAKIKNVPNDAMFDTSPGAGLCVIKNVK